MRSFAVLCALALNCNANPVAQQEASQQQPASLSGSLAYAVDLSAPVTQSAFTCMRTSLYRVAFIRAYSPLGAGQADPYAAANIRNANAAGMGTEIYMTPQPNSRKSGAQQFDEMYTNLRNSNINVRAVWIQVTSPVNWYPSTTTNINFLNSILARANQYGLSIGIYTSFYDWSQITGGATTRNTMLWYWNTYGGGPSSETPANFNDFRYFGGWTSPSVKQFGQVEAVCGVTVNRDVYVASNMAVAGTAKHEKSDQIDVGSFGLGGATNAGGAVITPIQKP